MSRTPLIAGNWKMNGSIQQVDRFAAALATDGDLTGCDLLVCPPFVYLERLARALATTAVAVGGQNLSEQIEPGAFTGEINGAMLADAGASAVIVGHSERRALYDETDTVVTAKLRAATAAGLRPILCVGETLEQREADDTEAILAAQIGAVLEGCSETELTDLVVAYEPVWAIGTGRSASAERAQEAHAFLRQQIRARYASLADTTRLLYGGSVKPDNACRLFAGADIDGALVGGASLAADSFLGIARATG